MGKMTLIKTHDNGDREYSSEYPQWVRQVRKVLLDETDWAASSDFVMSDKMREYRQKLRDIPQQPNFPKSFVIPYKSWDLTHSYTDKYEQYFNNRSK